MPNSTNNTPHRTNTAGVREEVEESEEQEDEEEENGESVLTPPRPCTVIPLSPPRIDRCQPWKRESKLENNHSVKYSIDVVENINQVKYNPLYTMA